MKKYLTKKGILSLAAMTLMLMPMVASAYASLGVEEASMGLGSKDLKTMVGSIINVLLGFLGIIAVVIILLGGFKWMTAAGNDDKIGEAKKLLGAGVVGLIIILAAYAIASFVITNIQEATQVEDEVDD